MRTSSLLLAALALVAAAMLVVAGCTTTPPTNQTPTNTTVPAGNATPVMTPAGNVTGNVTPNATPAPFIGTTWEWDALEVSGAAPVAVDDPANYTIQFTDNGTYGIKADCNVGGGDYTRNGTALNLTPPITTLIFCGNESLDQAYLAALQNVTSYGIDGNGRLILNLAAPGDRMVFVAKPGSVTVVSAPFVNATWQWIARAGTESIQVVTPSRYTIAFDANGTYGLRADCNTGRGNFTVNGTRVNISPANMTEAFCGDASLDAKYIEALGKVTGYQMDAQGRLVLLMGNAAERLVFQKAA